ncbi:hypothetical protein K1719_026391 [Acacia pycnantha]|nr:hypothetical protein K1719_026391 [Acacia pycnantha]
MMRAMEQMPLMESVVYKVFRIEPLVPSQYGKAKRDLVIESHEKRFKVKEGKTLFGYQPFATKDPKIFRERKSFSEIDLWARCAGKDFVMLVPRLLVVKLFLRYDSFEIQVGASPLGSSVTLTSLKTASF